MRGDRARAAQNGSVAARLAREHDLPMWRVYGAFFEGLATAELGALGEGLSDMRRGVEGLRQQGLLNFDGLLTIALANVETRAGDRDSAIAILDEALATADRLGYRAFEAELNRTRGEILLKRDPSHPAPAEEAFQTALAIAKQQGARSWGLRAAHSLAKLYQSTGRLAEAHAVLAPARKAGALLVREWKGRLERVMILEEGFAWDGQTFGSLSQIAKAMTGTNWNGHRFFGASAGKSQSYASPKGPPKGRGERLRPTSMITRLHGSSLTDAQQVARGPRPRR